jgi:hypothetical protein
MAVGTLLFMKDATLKLKLSAGSLIEFNMETASAHIEVTPGDEVTYPTLDGGVGSNVGPESYALVIKAAQNYSAEGLARFLWDNNGAVLDFDYNAHGKTAVKSTTTPAVTGQVRAVPGNYGGEVGTFAEIEVKLPCIAKPVLDTTP